MRRLKPVLISFAAIGALVLLTSGCGSVSASGGVSPATFLMPGVL